MGECYNIRENGKQRGTNMRIMAIDYGDARTGIAISDALGMLTGTTTVIHSWNAEKRRRRSCALCGKTAWSGS